MSKEIEEKLKFYGITESTLTNSMKKALLNLLDKNSDVFAKHKYDIPGCTEGLHKIDTGDAMPINCPPHKLSYHMREPLKKELDDMKKSGVIEPSLSDWAAPILMVKKKDGEWRLCVDFRKLNKIAKGCAYPLPRIQDIFTMLHRKKYFTTLDMLKGFWQIPLSEESKSKTAFTTVFGQWQFTRLPFGLASAPAAFQSIMNLVLSGLNWIHCMAYIDDILIFSETYEHHLETLNLVFDRLRYANLKLKVAKCEWARTELLYLGHVVNSLGIQADPKKVEAVKKLPPPRCVKDLETFVGKVTYYAKFIPDFSNIAKPLFDLKKKRKKWEFGPPELESFLMLRKLLCEAPILRHPDLLEKFMISTDASGYGIGAILSQEFEDGEHPIAYASRTLKEAECRYAVIEREALAIVWAVHHYEEYVEGTEFIVYTDHKPLIYLLTKDFDNKRLQNYALKLMPYQITILYREGSKNQNADTLSRYPFIDCKGKRAKIAQTDESICNNFDASRASEIPKSQVARESKSKINNPTKPKDSSTKLSTNQSDSANPNKLDMKTDSKDEQTNSLRVSTIKIDDHSLQSLDNVLKAYENISDMQDETSFYLAIRYFVSNKILPADPALATYLLQSDGEFLVCEDGTLKRRINENFVLCVPEKLFDQVFYETHISPCAGHVGLEKSLKRAQERYWWPGMPQYFREKILNCPQCISHKISTRTRRQPMGTRPTPQKVWERIHFDVWSPGGPAKGGKKSVIAFVDAFSKYLIAIPSTNHRAKTVMDVFLQNVVLPYGVPLEIISDGAPEFRGSLQKLLFEALGVHRIIVTPYRPQANGQIERIFRTIRPMLASISEKDPLNWPEYLPYTVHAYNCSYHSSVKNTPFYLMYGRDPIPMLLSTFDPQENKDYLLERENSLKIARDAARIALKETQEKNKNRYDKNSKEEIFEINDVVMILCPRPPRDAVQKLFPKYIGPYRVMAVENHVLSILPLQLPYGNPKRIHSDRAKKCAENIDIDLDVETLLIPFQDPKCVEPDERPITQ